MSEQNLPELVLAAVTSALGTTNKFIPLHEPEFSGHEWKYVKDCIDTGWVSTAGSYVDQFETALTEFTGAKFAIATSSGTAALHLALILAGVKSGDEVIVPALSFVATANAVHYCNAIPHFIDIAEDTLGLDLIRLEEYLDKISEMTPDGARNKTSGRRIAAIVPMHTFGHPVDLDKLITICQKFELPLVEDAAESLGSTYKGKHCGTFGQVSALSFNGNKVVTTGGGGAVLTNDEEIAKRAKHLSTTAKLPHKWEYIHDQVGYNYRMPNINAALGCAQLEQLPNWIVEKRALASKYAEAFEGISGLEFVKEPEDSESNYWLNAIVLDAVAVENRNAILEVLNSANYMSRPAWMLLHKLKPYAESPCMADTAIAERIGNALINLPSSPKLARKSH
jgi:perosamine synthetase